MYCGCSIILRTMSQIVLSICDLFLFFVDHNYYIFIISVYAIRINLMLIQRPNLEKCFENSLIKNEIVYYIMH